MPRSDEELEAGIGRVAHSLKSIGYAITWIGSADPGHPSWNAHVESFLVHARKLAEFLDPTHNIRSDDVRPDDFLGAELRVPVGIDPEVRKQIDKRLAHFTYAPIPDDAPAMEWPLDVMFDALRDSMRTFIDALPEGSARTRMEEAWSRSEPHFRKPVI